MQAAHDNWADLSAAVQAEIEYLDYPIIHEPYRETVSYRCPCCRCLTLHERAGYEICPVCFWEDDGQDDPYADQVRGGPNADLSLTQARQNYA
ncbi:CPCC family cysteine-rich protein, partial [Rhizobium sp. BR 250]